MTTELINAYSSHNLGDAAIMKSLARLSGDDEVLATLPEADPLCVPGVTFIPAPDGNTRLKQAGIYKKIKARISVGGDIFNNARPWLITKTFLKNLATLAQKPEKTIVFGQTIPASCKGFSRWYLASKLRKMAAVVVRDAQSYQLLQASGVDASLSYDAAFILESTPEGRRKAQAMFATAGLEPDKTALISVRSFKDDLYHQDAGQFVEKMARTCQMLRERGYQVAILVQSDVSSNDSDQEVASEIRQACPSVMVLDAFQMAQGDHDPVSTLTGILEIARIVIAVRYHAAILRLVSGRMPYHISYSRKGDDLNDRLGLPGCNLADFDPPKAIADIEKTAVQTFNHEKVRNNVLQHFKMAMSKIR